MTEVEQLRARVAELEAALSEATTWIRILEDGVASVGGFLTEWVTAVEHRPAAPVPGG